MMPAAVALPSVKTMQLADIQKAIGKDGLCHTADFKEIGSITDSTSLTRFFTNLANNTICFEKVRADSKTITQGNAIGLRNILVRVILSGRKTVLARCR